MSRKSKNNIFKNMTKEELNNEISKYTNSYRIYQRLIALRLLSDGHTYTETSEILNVSYQTVSRWAKMCEEKGLKGIIPKFGGGRPSFLTKEEKEKLDEIILKTPNMTMKDVHKIILDEFNVNYSMKQVGQIVKQLGYNYSKAYPKFSKTPKDAEKTLKKT